MATYKLKLFKHPNAPENGQPVDILDVDAQTHRQAVKDAERKIGQDAPAAALEHAQDRFILYDEDGAKLKCWDITNAPRT
jgi:hypothetical protein